MKKRVAQGQCLILFLCLSLLFAGIGQPVAADSRSSEKEEVVYGWLTPDGQIRQLTVVNTFGKGDVTDYGRYQNVQNLTSPEPIRQEDDRLSVANDADRFAYRGDLVDTVLPWRIEIDYYLEGQKMVADELAGQSGQLKVTIRVSDDARVDPVFYNHYMLQLSANLDGTTFSAIEAPGAVVANAGQNKIISYTVLPGQDAEIELTALADTISFAGFEFSALPFSLDFERPDTDSLIRELTTFSNAVSTLNDGLLLLSDGVSDLSQGSADLAGGSKRFAEGLSELDQNSGTLAESSGQIQNALQQINSALADMNFSGDEVAALAALPDGLRQLADGLNQVAAGLTDLQGGFSEALTALTSAIEMIPQTEINPSELYAAIYGQEQLETQLSELMRYYGAAKNVQGTFAAVEAAFSGVSIGLVDMRTSVQEIADVLESMAAELDESLRSIDLTEAMTQLSQGLSQLETEYQRFDQGLNRYTDGVHELAGRYPSIQDGLADLSEGTAETSGGLADLADGSTDLAAAARDLPEQIEAGLTDMISPYDTGEWKPRSFVSEKNTDVNLVQFVLRTDPITPASSPDPAPQPPERLNFFQKLLKLFGLLD